MYIIPCNIIQWCAAKSVRDDAGEKGFCNGLDYSGAY